MECPRGPSEHLEPLCWALKLLRLRPRSADVPRKRRLCCQRHLHSLRRLEQPAPGPGALRGPNVYIAYSLVGTGLFDVAEALAISAMSGLVLVLLALTPLLRMILGLMPLSHLDLLRPRT